MSRLLLELAFIGTASAAPAKERRLPGAIAKINDSYFVLDCGEGFQYSLLRIYPRIVNKKLCVLISHMHGDHVLGLPGLLLSLGLAGRTREVVVIGPRGIKGFIESTLDYLKTTLPYKLIVIKARKGLKTYICGANVSVELGKHSVPNYAYRVDGKEIPGKFHPERAVALGVPRGPLWKKLQNGQPVEVNGRIILPEEVAEPPRKGPSLGYSGDTRPVARLTKFFSDVDVLVFEATYVDRDKEKAIENMHTTALEAAEIALKSRARYLVLTHFSNRYKDTAQFLEEARTVFPNVFLAREGRIFRLTSEGFSFRDEPLY